MSQNSAYHRLLEPKLLVLLDQNSYLQLYKTEETANIHILEGERLEDGLINYFSDKEVFKIVDDSFSVSQIIDQFDIVT